jgi:hypothetical protein
MCCLQLIECAVCFLQHALCGPKHPLHQVLDLYEVPSFRLGFLKGCSLNLPHFGEQHLAMILNPVGAVAASKCPAQLLLNAESVQVQLLNFWAGFSQLVAVDWQLLVSSICNSPHLLKLTSASSCLLFFGFPLLLLRLSIAGPSAGSLSLGLPWRSSPWWSRLPAGPRIPGSLWRYS